MIEVDVIKVVYLAPPVKRNWETKPQWWNGRHVGLKIQWEIIPCRFESGLRYKTPRKTLVLRGVFHFGKTQVEHLSIFLSFGSP